MTKSNIGISKDYFITTKPNDKNKKQTMIRESQEKFVMILSKQDIKSFNFYKVCFSHFRKQHWIINLQTSISLMRLSFPGFCSKGSPFLESLPNIFHTNTILHFHQSFVEFQFDVFLQLVRNEVTLEADCLFFSLSYSKCYGCEFFKLIADIHIFNFWNI